MKTLNMIGKPCPIPVVEAKKVLSQPNIHGVSTPGVNVLVDNIIAVQNLKKMAAGLGYDFYYRQKGKSWYTATIRVKNKDGESKTDSHEEPEPAAVPGGVTFFITGDQIGISEAEPGKKLMKSFLYSLAQSSNTPETILLVNAGVKLAVQGADTLDDLKTLAANGTRILSCGQCLNYYGLTEKLAVGESTNMLEIIAILTSAAKSITL